MLAAFFLGLFALDAFSEGKPFVRAVGEFVIHLLPAAVVLAIVALAWRREWIGALAFGALAIAYAASVPSRVDWILVISGPLFVIGALYWWCWRARALRHA
jgi:hypothetical protein